MTLTWEEAEVAALDIQEWRRSVAQCIHLDAGWIKQASSIVCLLISHFIVHLSAFYLCIFVCILCIVFYLLPFGVG